MSDSVTNLVGTVDPKTAAAAALQNAKAPLADLFADVLDKTNFADRMLPQTDIGLARAPERDYETRPDIYSDDHADTDAEPVEDAAADSRDADDRPLDDEEQGPGERKSDELQQDALLDLNAAAAATQKPGLTVQPNGASGVELQSKADGTGAERARTILTRGEVQAAANGPANGKNAVTSGQNAAASANAANANNPSAANGQFGDVAVGKSGTGIDAAAAEKSHFQTGATLTQSPGTASADGNGVGALLEKYTLLIRAGAKRAAELHQMKIRLEAHRDAIKKVIAQNVGATNSTLTKPATPGADAPSLELTAGTTPLASGASPARPTTLFNSPTPGTLPGQASSKGAPAMAIGDSASNSIEQSTAAADRQTMTSNAARGLNLRPMPAQQAYQPAEQVKVHIQQLVKSDADRIQVKLSPASLGRVEVILDMSPDKAVQAIVYAEKPETLDMLERDARVLQKAFEEAGMKFDSDSLMFKQGQSGDAGTELADGAPSSDTGDSADGDDLDASDATTNEQPSRRQHDGMLDLEI